MIDLAKIKPFARKQWVKRKFDEYENSNLFKAAEMSSMVYAKPYDDKFKDVFDRPKWKATVDRKVNYLLARKPVMSEQQDMLDKLLPFIKETAKEYILRGSLIWIVQGDGESIEPVPLIMSNAIAVYADENREDRVAIIRKRTDIEIDKMSGEEKEVEYYECYYDGNKKSTYCYTLSRRDKEEVLAQDIVFIELGKTGDAPLFAYVEPMLVGFDDIFKNQDSVVNANTKPLIEVRGYSGTDDYDLRKAVENDGIVKTEGTGGITVHTRSMDSASVDTWYRRLAQEYYEATSTVGKDNELAYAQSGKAMDRLFIDMENSARELSHVLEKALTEYFDSIGVKNVDIVWNTDRPVDDSEIINSIATSQGLLSQRTLLEQHPWVDDVDEELRRLAQEGAQGMEEFVDENMIEEVE